MGVSLSTARYLAPASFVYDFALQQYGLFASPNMKDIHDANLSFWSPQPYFIGGFFFPQQLFQLAWMYRLWRLDEKSPKEKAELDEMVRYVPWYALGNVCIGSKYNPPAHHLTHAGCERQARSGIDAESDFLSMDVLLERE